MDSFSPEAHAARLELVMIYEDANCGTGTQVAARTRTRTSTKRSEHAISDCCHKWCRLQPGCRGAELKPDAIKCNSYIVNRRYS